MHFAKINPKGTKTGQKARENISI